MESRIKKEIFREISLYVYRGPENMVMVNGTQLCQILADHELLDYCLPNFGGEWKFQSKTLDEFVNENMNLRLTILASLRQDLDSEYTIDDLLKRGFFVRMGKGTPMDGIYIPECVANVIILETTHLTYEQREKAIMEIIAEIPRKKKGEGEKVSKE